MFSISVYLGIFKVQQRRPMLLQPDLAEETRESRVDDSRFTRRSLREVREKSKNAHLEALFLSLRHIVLHMKKRRKKRCASVLASRTSRRECKRISGRTKFDRLSLYADRACRIVFRRTYELSTPLFLFNVYVFRLA